MENTPIIEFKNVTKRFGRRMILDQINLKIYEGQITTIIGKSGAGKSVLLKHIIGLLDPDEGTILYKDRSFDQMGKHEQNEIMNQISYMFQNNALFDSKTVFENIAMPLRESKHLSEKKIKEKVMDRIKQFELSDVARMYPAQISGGMEKRTALARALVTDPKIVLFDEPTTGQDPVRKNTILRMITQYQRKYGFTAILISHDIPDVYFISNRLLVLYDKKIIFQGTPKAFDDFEHPYHDELIRSFNQLQQGLSGLTSKRHFKVRYQIDLDLKNGTETYAVALFTLEDFDTIIENLGYQATQKSIKTMGAYINRRFGAMGGISARRSINQFGTVFPYSDIDEARRLLERFITDLQTEGLAEIEAAAKTENPSLEGVKFSILAGLASGNPDVELQSVMEFAEFTQKPIAQF